MKASAMTKVASSNIDAVHHADGALYVRFTSGKTYRYEGVSRDVYVGMINAESVGGFFARHIRPAYQGEIVELEKEDA